MVVFVVIIVTAMRIVAIVEVTIVMIVTFQNDNFSVRDLLIIQGNYHFENLSSLIIFAVQ